MMRVAVWDDGTEWEVPGVLFETQSASSSTATSSTATAVKGGKLDKRAGKVARMKAKHPQAVAATEAVRKKPKVVDAKAVVRPLVLWLKKRPDGVPCDERHQQWKQMSAKDKTAFSQATKAERNAR